MPALLKRILKLVPDPFLFGLVGAAALGAVLPVSGLAANIVQMLTTLAIAAMFFMQGVRLSREAVLAGLANWRAHLVILACTFVLYPALGLLLRQFATPLLPAPLWTGVVFLCLLPSTVQSSIAYVSIARGDVATAVCAATASNLLGIFVTPLLGATLLHAHGAAPPLAEIGKIAANILAPFILGQILRPKLADWAARHKAILQFTDRGSIILVVYTAFSAATLEGVWRMLPLASLGWLLLIEAGLLCLVLVIATFGARTLRFATAEEIAIVFCGSKKSLASGAPMASILFPAASLGPVIIPLVLFHQMQLMVGAMLAARYARRPVETVAAPQ